KSHSPNDTMNPKGVTTKGLWIKVFVKALPNTATSQINFCLQFSQQAKKNMGSHWGCPYFFE
uniref:hypothetical protein n=1 Tax=Prevotella sp. TaxID=59823 RepID=UPI00402989E0